MGRDDMRQGFIGLHPVRRRMVRVIDERVVGIQTCSAGAGIARIFQNDYRLALCTGKLRRQQASRHDNSKKKRLHCGTSMNSTVRPARVAISRLSFNGIRVEDIGATDVTRMICQGVSVPLATASAFWRIPW